MPAQAPVIAARVLSSRTARRWLSCGCTAAAAAVAAPLFLMFAAMSGALSSLPGVGAAGSQVDGAAPGAGVLVGGAQPLPPGRFAVSQGFGCTRVGVEATPPPQYTCPPDAAHGAFTRFHTGIDLAAASGVPVLAVISGTAAVSYDTTGLGTHVILTGPSGAAPRVAYVYGHLSGTAVLDGEAVDAGEVIGYVGSTGNSTGSHLHFEVDVGGVPVNPCSLFPSGYLVPPGVGAVACLAWAM